MASNSEHDMVHVVISDEEIQNIYLEHGQKGVDAFVRDLRAGLCPDMSAAELQVVDMVEPMRESHHRADGQVEFYQKVDVI